MIGGNFLDTDPTGTVGLGSNPFSIIVVSANNTIGGTSPADRNIVAGSILVTSSGAANNRISGNFIGVDATGTHGPLTPSSGSIGIAGPNNTIGGTTPAARNIIVGAGGIPVDFSSSSSGSSAGSVVQGNYIGTDVTGTVALGNNLTAGVRVANGASHVTIGGDVPGAGNLITGNHGVGITITGSSNVIQGNLIGTDVTGTRILGTRNSATGVAVVGSDNTIGGTIATARNVIAGYAQFGIVLSDPSGSATRSNRIQGNFIGTDITGTVALGNGPGVQISFASGNTIGGSAPGAGNVISGNTTGIHFNGGSANVVQGNFIGTDLTGTLVIGNRERGIDDHGNGPNSVIGNTIANNALEGVRPGVGGQLLSNSIFNNTGLGIDIVGNGVTPNTSQGSRNFPVITSAMTGGGNTTIIGILNSTPNTSFTVQFFANAVADPTGFGEGQQYLGQTVVTTNGSGNASFTTTLATPSLVGTIISATSNGPAGTSEFSQVVTATPYLAALSIAGTSVTEGHSGTTEAVFAVSLSQAVPFDVSVGYATADGTATASDADYVPTSGTLTIPAGQVSGSITVPVNGDAKHEPDETFTVNLSGAIGATIDGGQGVGTILNDDPVPSISINSVHVFEGDDGTTPLVFTVSLTNPSSQTITVDYATTDGTATAGDYMAASGPLTIPAGMTSGIITVPVNGDTTDESDETFNVVLSNPVNATINVVAGVGTIKNDDPRN